MNKSILYTAAILIALTLNNCSGTDTNTANPQDDSLETIDPNSPAVIRLNNRLFSIPSPFQVAMLVKDIKAPYNKDLLNPTTNASNYTTTFKQALNLGVYGANLGYLNIYEQLPDAGMYFAVVKVLANDLGISSSFDKNILQRIESNQSNKDSLIFLFSYIYRDADAFLMNNDRNDVSILVLTGGWIESLYFLAKTAVQTNNKNVIDRIGEQKHPLDNLIELLRPYYGNRSDEFDKIIEDLVELATIFDGIIIEYTYENKIVQPDKNLTTIKSTSNTIISEYQLKSIAESITAIRKRLVE